MPNSPVGGSSATGQRVVDVVAAVIAAVVRSAAVVEQCSGRGELEPRAVEQRRCGRIPVRQCAVDDPLAVGVVSVEHGFLAFCVTGSMGSHAPGRYVSPRRRDLRSAGARPRDFVADGSSLQKTLWLSAGI